jgi:hypothetical protein
MAPIDFDLNSSVSISDIRIFNVLCCEKVRFMQDTLPHLIFLAYCVGNIRFCEVLTSRRIQRKRKLTFQVDPFHVLVWGRFSKDLK